jgi:anaphase-promoting complex subunit 2
VTDFRTNKPSDVISTLVSIYDSKDLFVKELQVLLAQRLLAINDDSTERVEKEVGFFQSFDVMYTDERCTL